MRCGPGGFSVPALRRSLGARSGRQAGVFRVALKVLRCRHDAAEGAGRETRWPSPAVAAPFQPPGRGMRYPTPRSVRM